jgi:ferritin-like metal-binding protein YciE
MHLAPHPLYRSRVRANHVAETIYIIYIEGTIMALFSSKTFESFDALLLDQIEDLYDAEQRLTSALPKMAEAAHDPMLKSAFQEHLHETEHQVTRLERIFQMLNQSPTSETCDAMKGLIKEGEKAIDAEAEPEIRDAALIAAAQRVEHYEIAAYGTARSFAERLGRHDVAQILQETLEEEKAADQKLNRLAEQGINDQAIGAGATRRSAGRVDDSTW